MPPQDLIDYIAYELRNNKSVEEINASLVASGWQPEDIRAAYDIINNPPQTSKNLSILSYLKRNPLFILAVLAVVLGIILVNRSGRANSEDNPENPLVQNTVNTGYPSPGLALNDGVCGTENYELVIRNTRGAAGAQQLYPHIDCFINNAVMCRDASLNLNNSITDSGIVQKSQVSYTLRKNNAGCELGIRLGKNTLAFPYYISEEQKNTIIDAFKPYDNSEGRCIFTNNLDIAAIFRDMAGDDGAVFAGNPYEKGVCTGSFFEAMKNN